MRAVKNVSPGIMPVLSRGKHRNARLGACFMEYASYLAGERWSDHPSCTHPALASLARLVNDWTSDRERSKLTVLIPSVIGLVGEDELLELHLAVRAAADSLPIACEARQRALAVGLLRCEARMIELDGDGADPALTTVRAALDQVPLAENWAREQLELLHPRPAKTLSPIYDVMLHAAVAGIGEACVSNPDERLRRLLEAAIDEVSLQVRRVEVPVSVSVEALVQAALTPA